jgi:polysaccharide export outer membrane protein
MDSVYLRYPALWIAVLAIAAGLPLQVHAQRANSAYRIGPKDLIDVRVYEVPELNTERRVQEDGAITLPLIGDVQAQGLTAGQLAERLKNLLEVRYVQRASVEIQIREFRSKPITVIGAVNSPGPLALSGRWTLLEALTAAGGLASDHGQTVFVLRRADNGLSDQISISVDDLLVRAHATVNIPIFANDLINVPATEEVTVFCLGEVRSPGALVFKSTDRITLLTAIARAGGLTERASRKILIKRGGTAGDYRELEVNFKRILSGKESDFALQEGDVVVVKESFL